MILFVSDGRPTDRDSLEENKEEILKITREQNARLGNKVYIQIFDVDEGKIKKRFLQFSVVDSGFRREQRQLHRRYQPIIYKLHGNEKKFNEREACI